MNKPKQFHSNQEKERETTTLATNLFPGSIPNQNIHHFKNPRETGTKTLGRALCSGMGVVGL